MAEKDKDNQLVTTLLVEVAVAGLISLGGFSTLFPNLIESVANGLQMETFKTLRSFTLVYTVLPIAFFTTFWFLKGSRLLQQERLSFSKQYSVRSHTVFQWLIIILKFSPVFLFVTTDFHSVNKIFLSGIALFGLIIIFVQRKYYHWVIYNNQYRNILKFKIGLSSKFRQSIDSLEKYDSVIYTMDSLYILGLIVCFRPWFIYNSGMFYVFVLYLFIAGLVSISSWWNLKRKVLRDGLSVGTSFKIRQSIYILVILNITLFLIGFINYPTKLEIIVALICVVLLWITLSYATFRFRPHLLAKRFNHFLSLVVILLLTGAILFFGQFNVKEGYQNSIRKTFIKNRVKAKNELKKQDLIFPKSKKCIPSTDIYNFPKNSEFKLSTSCQNDVKDSLYLVYYKKYQTSDTTNSITDVGTLNGVFNYIEKSILKERFDHNKELVTLNPRYAHPLNFYTWYIEKFNKKKQSAIEMEKRVEELIRLKTVRNDSADFLKVKKDSSFNNFTITDDWLNEKIIGISKDLNKSYGKFLELSFHASEEYKFEEWGSDNLNSLQTYHLNFTGHVERQLAERLESAQIIFASYLIESRLFGIYLLLSTASILSLIIYSMVQELKRSDKHQTFSTFAHKKLGYVFNISIIVALLLLIPLLRPINPKKIDPKDKFWMMTLKDWDIPPFERKEFYPLDGLNEGRKREGLFTVYTKPPEIIVKLELGDTIQTNNEELFGLFNSVIDQKNDKRFRTKQLNE